MSADRTSPGAGADVARLRWRSGDTTRHLLLAFVGAFGIALATSVPLWLRIGHGNLLQVLLLTHLAAGCLALLFFIPFVVVHWRDGREPLIHLLLPLRLLKEWRWDQLARHRLIGHALMWSLGLVFASGCVIALPALLYLAGYPATLPYGGHVWLLAGHLWATPVLLLALASHLPLKERP